MNQRFREPVLLVSLVAVGLAGCWGGDNDTAGVLLDGTPARESSVELEGIEAPAVLTSTAVLPVESLEAGSPVSKCLDEHIADAQLEGPAVLRVSLSSESVTVHEANGLAIHGCNNTAGPREHGQRWCGGAFAQLHGGRLGDPRLHVGCTTSDGLPVAFAWIEPGKETRYVVVDEGDHAEVYEVAAGLPVRVSTIAGVDAENSSSATFDISEHDAEGRLLRAERLEAFVAG